MCAAAVVACVKMCMMHFCLKGIQLLIIYFCPPRRRRLVVMCKKRTWARTHAHLRTHTRRENNYKLLKDTRNEWNERSHSARGSVSPLANQTKTRPSCHLAKCSLSLFQHAKTNIHLPAQTTYLLWKEAHKTQLKT